MDHLPDVRTTMETLAFVVRWGRVLTGASARTPTCVQEEDRADCDFDRLDLSTNPYLEKNLEFLCNWIDDLSNEQIKFNQYTRNLQRQKQVRTCGSWDRSVDRRMDGSVLPRRQGLWCSTNRALGRRAMSGGVPRRVMCSCPVVQMSPSAPPFCVADVIGRSTSAWFGQEWTRAQGGEPNYSCYRRRPCPEIVS